jgi:hypothetical protein
MDMVDNKPQETVPVPVLPLEGSVPASVPAPVASTPEAAPVPASVPAPVASIPEASPVPVGDLAGSVLGTGTPHPSGLSPRAIKTIEASPSTGGLVAGAAAPAPVEVFKGIIPTTKGNAPGGWNRFAGYNPHAAKNKQKDGRGGSGRR